MGKSIIKFVTKHKIVVILFLLFIIFIGIARYKIIQAFEKEQKSTFYHTIFYDIHKKPFYELSSFENYTYVPLNKISPKLQKSVIAIEDTRFYYHFGFDPIRIIGSIPSLFGKKRYMQGASTLTQQLAKLTLLLPKRTLSRKIKELLIAVTLETAYSKNKILEFYLNKIYLGNRNYGIEAAAKNYFHTTASKLTWAQSAFLAALIKRPEGYSPFADPKPLLKRQRLVLYRLYRLGRIDKKTYIQALQEKLNIYKRRKLDLQVAPYFINHLLLQLKKTYTASQIYHGGLHIYTTLDLSLQKNLEKTIQRRFRRSHSFSQASAVSLDPKTGYVYALIGGRNFLNSEFNRPIQSKRQLGSSIKPILYAAALTQGIKINDSFMDIPTQYPENYKKINQDGSIQEKYYEPQNFEGEHFGPMTLSYALRHSNNVVSVKVLSKIGISTFNSVAMRFGLHFNTTMGLCLALGCGQSNLLSMVSAYSVFANNGERQDPVFIKAITDASGKIIEKYSPTLGHIALSPGQAYQMNRLLQEVVENGTGRNAHIKQVAGGKTGTTDDYRDAYFIGFTADLVTGFWIGNDNNTSMIGETGGQTPARLWRYYMNLHAVKKKKHFPVVKGFKEYLLEDKTGKLPTPYSPKTSWYPLHSEDAPTEYDSLYTSDRITLSICLTSGKIATKYCPKKYRVERTFYLGDEPKYYDNIYKQHNNEAILQQQIFDNTENTNLDNIGDTSEDENFQQRKNIEIDNFGNEP